MHSNSVNAEDNIPHSLTRTKSSGSLANQAKSPSSLLKSKSSTFISPDQSEALMYNTKVTLTLRRSNSRLNSSVGDLNAPPEIHNGHLSNGIHQNGTKNGGPPTKCQNSYYFGSNAPPPPPPASSKPSLLKTVTVCVIAGSCSLNQYLCSNAGAM